jgi:methyltransferase (TIGR00027 family)
VVYKTDDLFEVIMQAEIQRIIQQHFHSSQKSQLLKPSSLMVAIWRAAHQLIEKPLIFEDSIALRILGDAQQDIVTNLDKHQDLLSAAMRIAIVVRSRFAEDERALSGCTQYVILGAGLDTYAYRSQMFSETVFEIDHPKVQIIKQQLLKQNNIEPKVTVNYVGCDFEQQSLASCLAEAGFYKNKKTFFSWLGVVPYLTEKSIIETLEFISSCAPGSKCVFDYIVEPNMLNQMENMVLQMLGAQLAAGGEPLKSFYSPDKIREILLTAGFKDVMDIDADYLNERYLSASDYAVKHGRVTRMAVAEV